MRAAAERHDLRVPRHGGILRHGTYDGPGSYPVRKVFDYAAEHFLKDLPICYALTVTTLPDGEEIYYLKVNICGADFSFCLSRAEGGDAAHR